MKIHIFLDRDKTSQISGVLILPGTGPGKDKFERIQKKKTLDLYPTDHPLI